LPVPGVLDSCESASYLYMDYEAMPGRHGRAIDSQILALATSQKTTTRRKASEPC